MVNPNGSERDHAFTGAKNDNRFEEALGERIAAAAGLR